jgi:hypothetical protein
MGIGLVGNRKCRKCPESRQGNDLGTVTAKRVLREGFSPGFRELVAK